MFVFVMLILILQDSEQCFYSGVGEETLFPKKDMDDLLLNPGISFSWEFGFNCNILFFRDEISEFTKHSNIQID